MEALIAKFIEWIKESEHIVFFGGAGVSTESGIPDFRSKDGLYNQHDVQFDKYQPEYLLSHTCLMREPEVFFEFYRQKWIAGALNPMSLTGCWRSWKRSENWMLSLHRISMGCISWLDQNVSMRSMGRPTKIIVHPAERESARIIFLRRPVFPDVRNAAA